MAEKVAHCFLLFPLTFMIDCSDSFSSSCPVMCVGTMLTKYFESQQENYIIGTVKNDLDLLFIMLMGFYWMETASCSVTKLCENAYHFFWHVHFGASWHSCRLFCACRSVGSYLKQFSFQQN